MSDSLCYSSRLLRAHPTTHTLPSDTTMNSLNRRHALQMAAFAAMLAAAPVLHAQESWPTRPIRLIVAFAPGGFTDIAARLLGQALSTKFGQAVIVDNRAGAAGIIGTQAAAQAAPDGYTLLLGTISTHAINVGLYHRLPYDPVKNFAPVAGVASGELLLVVHPSVTAKNVADLIALAKAKPGKLTYASGGNGTTSHLAAELFKSMANVDLLHVPFRSPALGATGLLSGQVDLMFDTLPAAIGHVRSGRMRAIGVTGRTRSAELPNVPAVAEALPGFTANTWAGLYAPAGTPANIIATMDAAVRGALESPELRTRLADIGMRLYVAGPEEFAAYMKAETMRWVMLVRKLGITAE